MKKISKEKIFILLTLGQLFIISIFYILISELLIRKYVIPINNDIKSVRVFKKSKSPNVIWGDSQTMEGINNLKGFVNLSYGGDTYLEIEAKIKKYYEKIPTNQNKKAIFLLATNAFGDFNNRPNRPIVDEMFLSRDEMPILYMSKKYFQKRAPLYLKNFLKNGFKLSPKKNVHINIDGSLSNFGIYQPENQENNYENNFQERSNITVDLLQGLIEDSVYKVDIKNSSNYQSLKRIIVYFNQNNIKTCYLSTPRHKNYSNLKIHNGDFKKINLFYKKLSDLEDLTYFDFSDIDYPANFYSDPKHLNNIGAKHFTKVVKENCFQFFEMNNEIK